LGKRMVCVTSRGSDYSPGSPMHAYDFQQPYLRAIFGFIGITDLSFISVEATDISSQREAAFARAEAEARTLASSPQWSPHVPAVV
jgi:FMN-dependent NADH-azoreductase